MSVYVDKLRDWGWKLGPSCHLIADTNEELHEFAAKVGMQRSWFQPSASGPHYDLTKRRRAIAVNLGAIELEDKEFHEIIKKWRKDAIEAVNKAETEAGKNAVRQYLFR